MLVVYCPPWFPIFLCSDNHSAASISGGCQLVRKWWCSFWYHPRGFFFFYSFLIVVWFWDRAMFGLGGWNFFAVDVGWMPWWQIGPSDFYNYYAWIFLILLLHPVRCVKHTGHCQRSKDKLTSYIHLWTTTQCWLTSINLYSSPLCRHCMLSTGLSKKNTKINDESQRNPCCQHTLIMIIIILTISHVVYGISILLHFPDCY